MDHNQLKEALDKRFDKTDDKIDRLREDISKDQARTAVLENQMAGVIKVGFLILSAVIGIIAHIVRGGIQ